MNSSKTKLELQKHLTTLTNQEQAMIFEEVQVQWGCAFPCGKKRQHPSCETSLISNRRPELSRPRDVAPNSAWFKLEQPRGRARSELQIHIRSWFSSGNNKTRGEGGSALLKIPFQSERNYDVEEPQPGDRDLDFRPWALLCSVRHHDQSVGTLCHPSPSGVWLQVGSCRRCRFLHEMEH